MGKVITFMWTDVEGVQYLHDDPVVISLNIFNYDVNCVLVDNESSVDILFFDAFLKMDISPTLLKGALDHCQDFSETWY